MQVEQIRTDTQKRRIKGILQKSEQQKKIEIFDYDNYDSQFMHPMNQNNNTDNNNGKLVPKINKAMVLGTKQVQQNLTQIYNYYSRVYDQPKKQLTNFDKLNHKGMNIKSFLLFTKDFKILKIIFTLQRLAVIFKRHADYGKYLSFDNFYFTINSISHQIQVKNFFHLDSMLQNLDLQTIQQLQKQQFYNYLQLGSPENYKRNFTELFGAFNTKDQPRTKQLTYQYRKFSLPQLRKKALPENREKKKGEKDLFILKNQKQVHQSVFDEAKSIVVSWDSLRAKSVNNLGKPSDIVQKKYLKIDPQQDPYLKQMRPSSRNNLKIQKQSNKNLQQRIKQIQKNENVKNLQILNRIQKKLKISTARKLKI